MSKSWFVNLLSCIALFAFMASPCDCFAKESDTAQNTKENSHACCDKDTSNSSKQDNECDDCNGCIISSCCSSQIEQLEVVQNFLQYGTEHSAKTLVAIWPSNIIDIPTTIVSSIDPPGFRVASSTTLSIILQRWLI